MDGIEALITTVHTNMNTRKAAKKKEKRKRETNEKSVQTTD